VQYRAVRTAPDSTWIRAGALLLLLAIGAVLAFTLELSEVNGVRVWLAGTGASGLVAMVLGVGLVLLAPVPRSAVSVLVGVVAGFGPGLAVALSGAMLAGLVAFGLSRALGRSAAARLAGARLSRVDELMVERGFVSILLGRLLPLMPFVVVSYGAGLTAVRLTPYLLATALGIVPGTVVQVGIGASAGDVLSAATPLTVLPAVGVALAGAGGYAWRRRRTVERPAPEPAG
jgi:uncharacterized membrane protein YdjX (TVP38/TMEM64 family)